MRKKNGLTWLIYGLGCIELLLACCIFYTHYLCMDHAEHLHASWLVWQGKIPYRDFFEHHNPLLWYLLAPITALFYNNPLILYVGRAISAIAYTFFFTGLFKLCCDFLHVSRRAFFLTLILYFFVPNNLLFLFELQPDAFMLAAFIWGLFYFFRYLEDKKVSDLHVAFILFVISFLFLQKILLLLMLLGIYILTLLYKKDIPFKDFAKALRVPLLLIILFYSYLYYTNSLNLYLLFNYELNFKMQPFYGKGRILNDLQTVVFLPLIAGVTLHSFLVDGNRYRNILAGLMFASYALMFVTGSPYSQYFIFVNLISALIAAEYISSHWDMRRAKFFMGLLAITGGIILGTLPLNKLYLKYYQTHGYIMSKTDAHDPILNNVYYFWNIYGENASYYWFGYGNIAPVAHFLYGYDEAFDINKIILEQRPKFVYKVAYPNMNLFKGHKSVEEYRDYLRDIWNGLPNKNEADKEAFIEKWSRPYYYMPDFKLIDTYYAPTKYPHLMIRKDLAKVLKE